MAKARVELRGAMTHTARGRTFRKGVAQVLTNSADILYYQQQADFAVVILEDEEKPAKVKATPAPVADEDDEPEDDEPEGDEPEGDDEGDSSEPAKPAGKPAAKPAKNKGK